MKDTTNESSLPRARSWVVPASPSARNSVSPGTAGASPLAGRKLSLQGSPAGTSEQGTVVNGDGRAKTDDIRNSADGPSGVILESRAAKDKRTTTSASNGRRHELTVSSPVIRSTTIGETGNEMGRATREDGVDSTCENKSGRRGEDEEKVSSESEWASSSDWSGGSMGSANSGSSAGFSVDSTTDNTGEKMPDPRTSAITGYFGTARADNYLHDDEERCDASSETLNNGSSVTLTPKEESPLAPERIANTLNGGHRSRQVASRKQKCKDARQKKAGEGGVKMSNGEPKICGDNPVDEASSNRSLTVLLTELGLYQSFQRTALAHHLPAELKDDAEVERTRKMMTTRPLPRVDRPHFSPAFVNLAGARKGPTVSDLRRRGSV